MNYTERKRKILREITTSEKRTIHGMPYEVFENAPNEIKIKETDVDSRVWFIEEPRTEKIFLKEIHKDHFILKYLRGMERAVFKDQVVIHPKLWKGRI